MELVIKISFYLIFQHIIKLDYWIREQKSKIALMEFGWAATSDNPYPWDRMSKLDEFFLSRGLAVKWVS